MVVEVLGLTWVIPFLFLIILTVYVFWWVGKEARMMGGYLRSASWQHAEIRGANQILLDEV